MTVQDQILKLCLNKDQIKDLKNLVEDVFDKLQFKICSFKLICLLASQFNLLSSL
jgi:hypothetical protein